MAQDDLVDRRFLNSWSKHPFAMAKFLGRCLLMSLEDNPGQVLKWLLRMTRIKVDGDGLKHVAWKYFAKSVLVLSFLIRHWQCDFSWLYIPTRCK